MSEYDLAYKIRSGDESAFKTMFDTFYQSLCCFAGKYLNDNDIIADIVQEAFLKYWNKRNSFDKIEKVKSFLYIAIRNSCLNEIRNSKNKKESLDKVSTKTYFLNSILEEEARDMVYKAIDTLPPKTKEAVALSIEGLKNSEIAAQMQISEGTVHSLKKAAYKKLRVLLKDYYYVIYYLLFL